MSVRIQAAVVVLLCAGCTAWASPRPSHAPSADLFDSFRLLDRQFTMLDTEFHDLQQSLAERAVHAHQRHPWRKPAREMQKSTRRIEIVSYRMYSRYRRSGRRFGYRSFARLRRQAHRLNATMLRVSLTKSAAMARRETLQAKKAMLDLVLQYQALSGGYAAARCDTGNWICGAPKAEPRKVGYPSAGVKWTCLPRANLCKGILGPRAPQVTPEPLTAGPVR